MHISVLKKEVLHLLKPNCNENFIDCTAGSGGHTEAILSKNGPSGKVLAIEWDSEVFMRLKEKFKKEERVILVNESYTLIDEIVEEKNFFPVSGIIFDLGFSSFHVDESKRGFSFMRDEPLDMRYSKDNPLTAYDILNKSSEKDILHILKKWGEEEFAEKIAYNISVRRKKNPIETTSDLVDIIENSIPSSYKKNLKINCATKTFQALRIAVNGEILGIESALLKALNILERGGRMGVICFHNGEEKVIKKFLSINKNKIKILTSKPIIPTEEEVNKNIRSRSAKLYTLEKK